MPSTTESAPYNETNFLRAIAGVETSGGTNIKRGDNGKAWGKYQMHKVFVKDVNLLLGTNYVHADAEHPVKGEQLAKDAYRAYYSYLKNRGIAPTDQRMAYIWNGGRSAHEYTDPDWVSERIDQEGVRSKANNLSEYYKKFLTFLPAQVEEPTPEPDPDKLFDEAKEIPSMALSPEEMREFFSRIQEVSEQFQPFVEQLSNSQRDDAVSETSSDLK